MLHNRLPLSLPRVETATLYMTTLLMTNFIFNVLANAAFKISALSPTWRGFLSWQIVGNLAGFLTVLTLTALLRYLPLSIAFPLTTGLSILGVQALAAHFYFHESVSGSQWMGTLFIVLGIFLLYR